MNKLAKIALFLLLLALFALPGCDTPTSDQQQQDQQEQILKEGTAETGMPAIKNFRERKLLKDILELRDQNGLITYTYLENEIPKAVPGKTALGGKLTYLGESIGYGIPYATQYTNPQKIEEYATGSWMAIPQADPNGLFSPAEAEGTWVMMSVPGKTDAEPQYIEPRICVFTYKLVLIAGPHFDCRLSQLVHPFAKSVSLFEEGPPFPDLDQNLRLLSWNTADPGNGERMKKLVSRALNVKVELCLAKPENYGNILLIRTGDADFTHALVTPRRQGGLMPDGMRQDKGRLLVNEVAVPCETENDLFCYLGLGPIPPAERNAGMAYKLGARTQAILKKLDETLPPEKPKYAQEAA